MSPPADGERSAALAALLADPPPTLTVEQAGPVLGISTWTAYELVKRDEFPVPILRLGRAIRIPTRPLLDLLGIEPPRHQEVNDAPPAA